MAKIISSGLAKPDDPMFTGKVETFSINTPKENKLGPVDLRFVDWEGRPAVMVSSGFAYIFKAGSWLNVRPAEVADSGRLISEATFRKSFPSADISTIPNKVSSE